MKKWSQGFGAAFLILALLQLSTLPPAHAQAPPDYLSSMPAPQRITQDITGTDALDTAARRHAAFTILADVIQTFEGQMMKSAAARARYAGYTQAGTDVQVEIQKTFDPACRDVQCPRRRYFDKTGGYQFDEGFQRELLARYLPQAAVSKYLDIKAQKDAAFRARTRQQNTQAAEQNRNYLALRGTPPPLFTADEILAAAILTPVGLFFIWAFFFRKGTPEIEPPVSGNYGTARYAHVLYEPASPDASRHGLLLGKSASWKLVKEYNNKGFPVPTAPVFTHGEAHTLIVARTRSGKGTRVIVPTLLRYRHSVLAIDPKGENAIITALYRRDALDQQVHVVNPWNVLEQEFKAQQMTPFATLNPLDVLDRHDPNSVAIAQSLAATICPAAARGDDQFWRGSAAGLVAAVFLWLADQPDERKTLARMREIVTKTRKELTDKFLIPMSASEAFDGAIRELATVFIDMPEATYGGIIANIAESTRFLSDPQIKTATATSSFSMRDLATQDTTVYLVIPPDRIETQGAWLRLVLASAMHAFKQTPAAQRGQRRCLFLIDEFPALGRIDDIPRDIATMAGYGLDFALVMQGLDQLKAAYGDSANTIIGNCAFQWFCNIRDLDSAKHLSEVLGQKTVRTKTTSESPDEDAPGGKSESTTHGEMGRALLTPDEIMNLGPIIAIAVHPHDRPHLLLPVDYWRLEHSFAHLREKYPDLFWNPTLQWRVNPYVPREKQQPPSRN
ncbi:MAG: type IV secretory system conjugative DNA transfer family protein [Gammaproteobacteria bacterium]